MAVTRLVIFFLIWVDVCFIIKYDQLLFFNLFNLNKLGWVFFG